MRDSAPLRAAGFRAWESFPAKLAWRYWKRGFRWEKIELFLRLFSPRGLTEAENPAAAKAVCPINRLIIPRFYLAFHNPHSRKAEEIFALRFVGNGLHIDRVTTLRLRIDVRGRGQHVVRRLGRDVGQPTDERHRSGTRRSSFPSPSKSPNTGWPRPSE